MKKDDLPAGKAGENLLDDYSSDYAQDVSINNEEAGNGDENEKPKTVDIKRYKDIGGLTLRRLDWGLWYVEHKKILQRILIGFLILVSGASWSYTIYGFAYYYTRGIAEDELMAKQIIEAGHLNHEAILMSMPKDLVYDQTKILKANEDRYDFYARVMNPNDRHSVLIEYYFLTSTGETEHAKEFILPGETKYFLSLSNELESRPVNAQLRLADVNWNRIDRHEISDWELFKDKRIDFTINDAQFVPANQSGLSDKINLNHLEFTAKNNSAYNYWNVDFVILLYSGPNVVGINKYSIEEFMSGEEREAAMSWPGVIGRVSKVEIIPEVDITRSDIYIKHEGGIGEEK